MKHLILAIVLFVAVWCMAQIPDVCDTFDYNPSLSEDTIYIPFGKDYDDSGWRLDDTNYVVFNVWSYNERLDDVEKKVKDQRAFDFIIFTAVVVLLVNQFLIR